VGAAGRRGSGDGMGGSVTRLVDNKTPSPNFYVVIARLVLHLSRGPTQYGK